MIHYSAAVDRKAQRILKDKKFLKDCLKAGICPKCGTILIKISVKCGYHYDNHIKCPVVSCGYAKPIGISLSPMQ